MTTLTTIEPSVLAYVTIGLTSGVAGFLIGYIVRGMVDKTNLGEKNYANYVLVIVSTVWALSMFIDIISPAYETSPLVHGLMGAIVGFFYKIKPREEGK
jgi:uncharacterized membrane protein